jgi:type I restriction-modification system DNA methylase subunit
MGLGSLAGRGGKIGAFRNSSLEGDCKPKSLASLTWSVADLLRSDYKQSECGKVILPFTLLRRVDCVLEETKKAVLAEWRSASGL